MKPWTSEFLEVQHRANRFALAYDEAYFSNSSPLMRLCYFRELAIERARLELALADYRAERSRMIR